MRNFKIKRPVQAVGHHHGGWTSPSTAGKTHTEPPPTNIYGADEQGLRGERAMHVSRRPQMAFQREPLGGCLR